MSEELHKLRYLAYSRRSSESEDRQVASIEDQIAENQKLAETLGLNVVDFVSESQSAKKPGRPKFNEMLERIHKGEADAILCWKLNRLARNPIDGGQISWMLQQGLIKHIQTYSAEYKPSDNVLMMQVEFGMATQYVKDLSVDTKRGLRNKVKNGWRPSPAPVGYMNIGEVGNKIIIADPDRFDLVRKMFDLMLTGTYSVTKIRDIAEKEWGLRTFPRKRLGNKPLSMSHMYSIFHDPFYYGEFEWKNEDGIVELHKGKHPWMITKNEFDRIQILLGKKGKPQAQTREFSYTGLMSCGECGSGITAEVKEQCICDCKAKFSTINRTDCPRCQKDISEMNSPNLLKYTYYRCSKKRGPCSQKYISLKDLEKQVDTKLQEMTIDEDYLNVALDYLQERESTEVKQEQTVGKSLKDSHTECQTRLARLNREYTSSQNKDYGIYSPGEFKVEKQKLKGELESIKGQMGESENRFDKTLELSERVFNFCTFAHRHFGKGDLQARRNILSALGSNMTLKDKKLNIDLLYPYLAIEKYISEWKAVLSPLELENILTTKGKEAVLATSSPTWLRRQDSNLRPID